MFGPVLLPQQLERHEPVGLQFVLERSVVRRGKLAVNRRAEPVFGFTGTHGFGR
jgi:hypothetical protein